jgi:hypothetical protein
VRPEVRTLSVPELPHELAERYEVRRILGVGGFGRVLLAHDRRADREVALKLLADAPGATDARERFLREARVAAGLEHPHVLRIHDAGELSGGGAYLVSEVLGRSLAEVGAPDTATLIRWAAQVAEALDVAHRAGVVHRDVKPENILLRGEDAVLCDFGLVHVHGGRTVQTATGILLGTPPFMAPEIFLGADASAASDQWAWAACFYSLWQGRSAYPSWDLADVLEAVRDFRPPGMPEGGGLGPVLARALAGDPAARFGSMGEVAAALRGEGLEPGPSAAATVVLGAAPKPATPASRWWLPPALACLVLAGGLATWTRGPPPPTPEPAAPGVTGPAPRAGALPPIDVEPLRERWKEVVASAARVRRVLGVRPEAGQPVLAGLPRPPTGAVDEPGVLHRDLPELWERHVRVSLAWAKAVAEQDGFQRWTPDRLPEDWDRSFHPLHRQVPPLLLFQRTLVARMLDSVRRFGEITGRAGIAARQANDVTERTAAMLLEHPPSHGTAGLPVTWMVMVMRSRQRERLEQSLRHLIEDTRGWRASAHGLLVGIEVVMEGVRRFPGPDCVAWIEPVEALMAATRGHPDGDYVGCHSSARLRHDWLHLLRKCGDDPVLWAAYDRELAAFEACQAGFPGGALGGWIGNLDYDLASLDKIAEYPATEARRAEAERVRELLQARMGEAP